MTDRYTSPRPIGETLSVATPEDLAHYEAFYGKREAKAREYIARMELRKADLAHLRSQRWDWTFNPWHVLAVILLVAVVGVYVGYHIGAGR